jgi:hypothetical protein
MRANTVLAASAAFVLIGVVGGSAQAQQTIAGTPVTNVQRPWRVQLGGFLPTNQNVQDTLGRSFFSYGASYDLGKTTSYNPTMASVYFDGSSQSRDGARLSYYGLGLEGRHYFNPGWRSLRYYGGAGVGAYLLNNDVGGDSHNDTRLGAKLLAGAEMNNGFFGEANYTLINSVRGHSPNGFNLGVGYRF